MSINESILKQCDIIQEKKSLKERKDKGVFYTPPEVIERITEKVLSKADLVSDPYIKVLDPSCGAGLFLIKAFMVLKQNFEENFEAILKGNMELAAKLRKDDIGRFIVENNLWGADIDPEALDTAREILLKLAGGKCRTNLFCGDSLVGEDISQISIFSADPCEEFEFWNRRYDYIIGNPPYIGHKQVPAEYKKALQQLYKGIYRDKSDISYCFLKRGIDLLKKGGVLSYITSRYFMEGPSAEGIRKFIKEKCKVTEIVDFYGERVFQDAGVAACIITLRRGCYGGDTAVLKYRQGKEVDKTELFAPSNFEHFSVSDAELKNAGWVLLDSSKFEIFSTVEKGGSFVLADIADSYQGIITGCDKAFVVALGEEEQHGIERSLLRPWIKNSSISKHAVKAPEHYLIYSDLIKEEGEFPNAIKYIAGFRNKLQERRECKKGVRKWYQLQWGRRSEVFDSPKIIYPFKSSSSRFAVDEAGCYCSADIYSLKLKKKFEGSVTLEYIAAILNSKLFEFYFKCYAKKINESLYDYYPNTVLRMKLPMPEAENPIQAMAHELKSCKYEDRRNTIIYEIDRALYKLYGLNGKQIEIVEKGI